MLLHITAGALIALAPPQGTDTTFAVNPAHRLKVANFGGEVQIQTWDRNEVRVEADHSRRERVVVEQTGTEVRIRPSSWSPDFEFDIEGERVDVSMRFEGARVPAMVDYVIIVPTSMPIDVAGLFTDVGIEGRVGEVNVRVLEGDIEVVGAQGPVSARTGEGDVTVEDVQGALRLSSIDGEVEITNCSGEITAETTDGDITLANVRAPRVELESVDGDLWYSGGLQAQGFYSFVTHDGSVALEIPREASARFSVATWDGDLTTEFAVEVPERLRGRRFEFTLGTGGAQVEIESFDGDIEINYFQPDEE